MKARTRYKRKGVWLYCVSNIKGWSLCVVNTDDFVTVFAAQRLTVKNHMLPYSSSRYFGTARIDASGDWGRLLMRGLSFCKRR